MPGALWGVRTRLAKLRPKLTGDRTVVVVAPEGPAMEAIARLAVPELQGLVPAPVKLLAGGAGGLEGGRAAAGEAPPGPGGCRLHRRLSPPL